MNRTVVFSPEGRRLFYASEEGTLVLWDVATGEEIKRWEKQGRVVSAALSPDGRQAMIGFSTDQKKASQINLPEPPARNKKLAEVRRRVWANVNSYFTRFSPDGKSYLACGDGHTVRLWDSASGTVLHDFEGHKSHSDSAAFTPDGTQMISSSTDKTLRLWNVATGQFIREFIGHTETVYSTEVSPDGKRILSGSADCTLRLWNLETGEQVRVLTGHQALCKGVFTPDGQQIFSWSADGVLKRWETRTGRVLETFAGSPDSVAYGCRLVCGGRVVLMLGVDGVRWRDLDSGRELRRLSMDLHDLHAFGTSEEGRFFVYRQGEARGLHLWDLWAGKEVAVINGLPTHPNGQIGFSPDNRYIATGSWRGMVYLFGITSPPD
jgi:WD40 repeat protein